MSQSEKQAACLLRRLNIHGLDELDAVILAALANPRPLLLIGEHGTAKSALLNRLSRVMGLEHRHYNASLISFDDLLGFPVPADDGAGLKYLQTPANIWQAESVFLDEISRCRPETQNKLFSIVHERRVLGMALENLRYCWAAMNPPGAEEGREAYLGSLPLEAPLADRFAWIVPVPGYSALSDEAREQVLLNGDQPVEQGQWLRQWVEQARQRLDDIPSADRLWMRRWVLAVVEPLAEAGIHLSGRRVVLLHENLKALRAASQTLGREDSLEALSLQVLRNSLPQRAQGQSVPMHGLLAAHQEAVHRAGHPEDDFWQKLRREKDPVCRLALAVRQANISRLQLSQLFSDAWSHLSVAERPILARNLLLVLSPDRLTTTAQEVLLKPMEGVLGFCRKKDRTFHYDRQRSREWSRLQQAIAELEKNGHPQAEQLGNILLYLFLVERETQLDPQALIAQDLNWRKQFRVEEVVKEVA